MNVSFPGLVVCGKDIFPALWWKSLCTTNRDVSVPTGCPGCFQTASLKGNSGEKRMDQAVVLGNWWAPLVSHMKVTPLSFQ